MNEPLPTPPSSLKKQLSTLATTMPGQNAMVANQLDATRKLNMQNAIAQTATTKGPAAAQQLGTQAAAQQGQQQLQQQASNIATGQKIGQAFIEDRQNEIQNALRQKAFTNNRSLFDAESKLSQLDSRLKQDLLDNTMRFQEDELGRTIFNERQLLDYKIATAKDDNELLDYEQQVTQESQRKLAMLETAQKLQQEIMNSYEQGEQELDQAQMKKLAEAKKALDDKIRAERSKSANRAAMFGSIGAVVGAVGGAIAGGPAGGPAGAMAGARVGQGLGNVAAGTTKI